MKQFLIKLIKENNSMSRLDEILVRFQNKKDETYVFFLRSDEEVLDIGRIIFDRANFLNINYRFGGRFPDVLAGLTGSVNENSKIILVRYSDIGLVKNDIDAAFFPEYFTADRDAYYKDFLRKMNEYGDIYAV